AAAACRRTAAAGEDLRRKEPPAALPLLLSSSAASLARTQCASVRWRPAIAGLHWLEEKPSDARLQVLHRTPGWVSMALT
ncbi:unnamed protein product, partial [Urochloa humidicola]